MFANEIQVLISVFSPLWMLTFKYDLINTYRKYYISLNLHSILRLVLIHYHYDHQHQHLYHIYFETAFEMTPLCQKISAVDIQLISNVYFYWKEFIVVTHLIRVPVYSSYAFQHVNILGCVRSFIFSWQAYK